MKITVIGAGAVGGYFGGRLQEAGLDVTFLVREKRAEQLRQNGLIIKSPMGDVKLEPNIATNPNEIEACDLVILGMKNYHLQSALESIRPLTEKGAKVLPLLNGVEHFELLRQELGEDAVLGGICQIIVTLNSQGAVIHSNQLHDITFGPLHPNQADFCKELQEQTKQANMRLTLSDDVQVDMWGKYAFITAFSGVTTASRLPINEVMAVEAAKDVFRNGLREMQQLSTAKGVQLPEGFVDRIMETVSRMPDGSTSSMHQDFRKELSLEVESLQGAAVRQARQAGIEIPTIQTLYGLIKPYERL